MKIEDFLTYVTNGQIPPEPPDRPEGDDMFDSLMQEYGSRAECTKRGMWALVDQRWTKVLADWIGKRRVLEVMAGMGWLAKALEDHGIDIIATDNGSWNDRVEGMNGPVHKIIRLDAVKAVRKYTGSVDILMVSWPPYGDKKIIKACSIWGTDRPIVYIGEWDGCCTTDAFFEHFKEDKNAPAIPLRQWEGLHDEVIIGYWEEEHELQKLVR